MNQIIEKNRTIPHHQFRSIFITPLFIASFFANLGAEIHHITRLTDITPYITKGPRTLVLFDIDGTLLYVREQKATDEWFLTQVAHYIKTGVPHEEAVRKTIEEQLKAHEKTAVCQTDWNEDELIAKLKQDKVHIATLTARSIAFVDITYRQLKTVLIDLSDQKDWGLCFVMLKLPKPAHYVPGIIFAAGNDKGSTLEQFLRQQKYTPHHIIMVDDTPKNIESLDRMTKRLGIEFDGFIVSNKERTQLPCDTLST